MLMVLCKRARADDITPVCCLAFVDVDNGHDTSGAGLNHDSARLIELEGKDIFVICKRDDELHDKFASAGDDCSSSPPVGVLPIDAVVLFVDTDYVWCLLSRAISSDNNTVKILDHAQAVTAELQVICAMAKTTIAKVESLLAVERCSWICIRYALLSSVSRKRNYTFCRLLTISLNAMR